MLIPETEIRYDMLYMGPGNGCRHVLRCEAIGFEKELDCDNLTVAKRNALTQLEGVVFQKFRAGEYSF